MSREVVAEVIALIELGMIAPEDIVKCLRKANSEPAQQEPLAYLSEGGNFSFEPWQRSIPLYTSSQPAQQEYERGFIDGMQEQMKRSVDRAVNAMAQQALDKKAENARELGLDYEPAQQEPVAWLHPANATCVTTDPSAYARGVPLYTTPQPAQRKPLTDEELGNVFPFIAAYHEANKTLYRSIARAIEAAHGIKEKP